MVNVWNTGRGYAAEGQIIGAKQIPEGILFADASRNITGFITNDYVMEFCWEVSELDSHKLQKEVMANYDVGLYEAIPDSDENHNALEDICDEIKSYRAARRAA